MQRALSRRPDRIDGVEALGADETKWLAAEANQPIRWATAAVDVAQPKVLDLLEGRDPAHLARWLAARDPHWRAAVRVAVCDLHEPIRAAFGARRRVP